MMASACLGHITLLNAKISARPQRYAPRLRPGTWAKVAPKAGPWLHRAEARYGDMLARIDPKLDNGYGSGALPLAAAFRSPFLKPPYAVRAGHRPHPAQRTHATMEQVLGQAAQAAGITTLVAGPGLFFSGGLMAVVHGGLAILGAAVGLCILVRLDAHDGPLGRIAQEAAGAMALVTRMLLVVLVLGWQVVQTLMHAILHAFQTDPAAR